MLSYTQRRMGLYFGALVLALSLVLSIRFVPGLQEFFRHNFLLFPFVMIPVLLLYIESLHRFYTWGFGAIGESSIASELKNLPEGYEVVSDVCIGHENIDFVVVGVSGLWIIEVKSHARGTVSFSDGVLLRDGRRFEKDFLEQVRRQKDKLHGLLAKQGIRKIEPKLVVVFSESSIKLRFGFRLLGGSYVVGRSFLLSLIVGQMIPSLRPAEIGLIAKALRAIKRTR